RLPLGPNASPRGLASPAVPAGTKTPVPTGAPVVPLYSSTWLLPWLLTKRMPLGPNARPTGRLRPALPPVTKTPVPTGAPVVLSYRSTWLVAVLLTYKKPARALGAVRARSDSARNPTANRDRAARRKVSAFLMRGAPAGTRNWIVTLDEHKVRRSLPQQ